MEEADKILIHSGPVCHELECFNYYFPHDDVFLLISDTFRPVPWKYVDAGELQEIICQQMKEGFVFPLNPKWILCNSSP